MLKRFGKELATLEGSVLELGMMGDRQIERAMRALVTGDLPLAHAVIRDDGELNRARFHLDNVCLSLLAQNAPYARDLRLIVAVLGVASELERAGDHAEGIGRIAAMIGRAAPAAPLDDLSEIARLARGMLRDALDAFSRRDRALADRVGDADARVDALYDAVYWTLVDTMIARPSEVESCMRLLWVSHNLERIADRSTNVAARVAFLITACFRSTEPRGEPAIALTALRCRPKLGPTAGRSSGMRLYLVRHAMLPSVTPYGGAYCWPLRHL